VREPGGRSHAVGVVADNADPQTPERLVGAAQEAFGRIDGALSSSATRSAPIRAGSSAAR
jgi:NAD(P)-dependent dehydrogenase (short-subunit alcohol dehydrogenase family)